MGLPAPNGPLVLHGGGDGSDDARKIALDLVGGGPSACVLVLPQASSDPDEAIAYLKTWFGEQGVTDFRRFDPTNPAAARADLSAANFIWFSSGQQDRILEALADPDLRRLLRARNAAGCVVGGTSAGTAVVGEIAILGNPPTDNDPVPTAPGLGLWPGVVVDQHFAVRKREPRLRKTLKQSPGRIGVGIDEGACLVAAPGEPPRFVGRPSGSVVIVPAFRLASL